MNTSSALAAPRAPRPPAIGLRGPLPASPPRPLPARGAPLPWSPAWLQGFEASGGLVPAELLCGWMRAGTAQPISQLARWIVGRQVISLNLAGQISLPLCQFLPGITGLQPGLAPVLAELVPVFDEVELATWFATPNGALGGAAPADRLATDPAAVHAAARLDRYIARGG
jgi:hypothetical protein